MARMVGDPGLPLDEARHAGQSPQIRPEPVRAGAASQLRVDLLELLGGESGLAPGATGGPQAVGAGALPLMVPAADTLAADLQAVSDEGLDLAEPEPSGGLLASGFEGLEISPGTDGWLHEPTIHPEANLSLYYARFSKRVLK